MKILKLNEFKKMNEAEENNSKWAYTKILIIPTLNTDPWDSNSIFSLGQDKQKSIFEKTAKNVKDNAAKLFDKETSEKNVTNVGIVSEIISLESSFDLVYHDEDAEKTTELYKTIEGAIQKEKMFSECNIVITSYLPDKDEPSNPDKDTLYCYDVKSKKWKEAPENAKKGDRTLGKMKSL